MGRFSSNPDQKKGDMVYAWTTDSEIEKRAECGGAVTSLLKFALEQKMGDAVLAIKRGQDIYDAVPTLIKDPKDLANTAGSLHCGTVNTAKLVAKYLNGAKGMKIGMTVKGCDLMALQELAKRKQVNLDQLLLIGVNCGGTVSPVMAGRVLTSPLALFGQTVQPGVSVIDLNDWYSS